MVVDQDVLVMQLDVETFADKSESLGVVAALMIVSGCYGELTVTGNLQPRWVRWAISMVVFLYIVQELLVSLCAAGLH